VERTRPRIRKKGIHFPNFWCGDRYASGQNTSGGPCLIELTFGHQCGEDKLHQFQ
jgi:hypothetical protein